MELLHSRHGGNGAANRNGDTMSAYICTQLVRHSIYSRDDHKCVYCGATVESSGYPFELDHIHPRSKGGSNDVTNLVTSCKTCNASKNDGSMAQFSKRLAARGIERTTRQLRATVTKHSRRSIKRHRINARAALA